jgi:quercetin dioxygenase-like cupin family protein
VRTRFGGWPHEQVLRFSAVLWIGAGGRDGSGKPGISSNSSIAFNNAIPNIPGKSIVAVLVNYPPGARSPPHHHAASAFITAYVLEGAILSQVDSSPPKVYHAGEYFTEKPGSRHEVSANASTTEPAKMLAVFVLDTGEMPLSIPDK